jgi:hypothetical protein
MVAAAWLVAPLRSNKARSRLLAVEAALMPVLPFAICFGLTGSFKSNAAIVKLLLGNPYFAGPELRAAFLRNLRLLGGTLLNGEVWSAEFLPRGGAFIAVAGLLCVLWCGWQTKSPWRAACVVVLALAMAAPCLYVTFLWNRLRYLWPFATGWLIGLACLARVTGEAAASFRARYRVLTPVLCGVFCGMFATHLGWALDDVADSASAIDRQHVFLGRWAAGNLPVGARIGVNDTGAIAYFSDRHTFDIVGLTTKTEGQYWIAGAASRF